MEIRNNRIGSLRVICFYTGIIVLGVAALMGIPIVTALLFREWNPLLDFIIGTCISSLVGMGMILYGKRTREDKAAVEWKHGFAVAALSWLVLMVLCALPYRFSGHTNSLLDACFDVMSGFTTTGLALTQDLDHLSISLNMWRHILTFVGGQGMVVLALSLLVKEAGGAYKMYVGEGKDIGLVPNVKHTARLIWKISIIYMVIGTAALWIDGIIIGLKPVSAFLHGLFIFESSWSTGGFAPMSQNIMYYHSLSYEMITIVFFLLGSFNFGLHYAVWRGKKKELIKNIELQSFFITSFLACLFASLALKQLGIYNDAVAIFRRVIYNVLSAHTTTGFGSVYARQFAHDWGGFGIFIMIAAMLIGGSACSTAGGFKGLRVGIVFKGIIADVKRHLSSEKNVRAYKYHHIKEYMLDDGTVKSAALIIILYMVTFGIGTALGAYYGYPFAEAAFESASVTGNVGLTIGVTVPQMPAAMKIYYIIAMYLGRLEFLSVFVLVGYVIKGVKRICKKK